MNLKVRLIRKRKKDLNRLIDTVRFLCHIISGDFIGPGPASPADLAEFTPSAFSLITVCVPETLEDLGIDPDLPKGGFLDVSAVEFQVATGLNLTHMGNEAEGDASETSPGHGIESVFLGRDLFALLFGPLTQNAIIMGGAGRLELKGNFVSLFIEPVKRLFIILGRDLLILELLPPARWNQEKDVKGHGTEINCKAEDFRNQMEIDLRNGRIDLEIEASLLCHLNSTEGAFKRTLDLAKGIMGLGIRAIEADTDPLNPGILHLLDRFFR